MSNKTERRTVMARDVARRWIKKNLKSEYRLTLYAGASSRVKNISGLLKAFRDGKARIASVQGISDLGIRDYMDRIEIWSSDKDSLRQVKDWFEKRGVETSGLW